MAKSVQTDSGYKPEDQSSNAASHKVAGENRFSRVLL